MTDKPEGNPDFASKSSPPPADKKAEAKPPSADGSPPPLNRGPKPFPWPILLAIAVPAGVAGLLGWLWQQEDLYTLGRTGWICLSVVLPGFGVMTILGGVAQIRRRPILSTLALLLAIATILACIYDFRLVTEAKWLD